MIPESKKASLNQAAASLKPTSKTLYAALDWARN
jgi:hypothetical protein